MSSRKLIFLLSFFLTSQVLSYDVVKRIKTVDDRLKTHDMMNPIGHDFHFDLRVGANTNLIDVIDDADKAANAPGDLDAKLAEATTFLRANDKTEQHLNAKAGLGFPLPSFSLFGINFKPGVRANWNIAAQLGIFSAPITAETILTLVDVDLPPALANAIVQKSRTTGFTANQDIVKETCDDGSVNSGIAQFCVPQLYNKYFFPDGDAPNIFVVAKQDVKGGAYMNYESQDGPIFGDLNFYGLHRTDINARITQGSIASGRDIIDLGDELNSEVYFALDWRVGARFKNYRVFASIEELKLATISDREAGSSTPVYGTDPLLRAHGEADFQFAVFKLTPFAGFHKRSGYGLSDGYYVGADWGMNLMNDNLGLRLRTQLDREHLSLSPNIKFLFFHLDYLTKIPVSSEREGIKVATIHSLNVRFFF
jgi:hypothetical protein